MTPEQYRIMGELRRNILSAIVKTTEENRSLSELRATDVRTYYEAIDEVIYGLHEQYELEITEILEQREMHESEQSE